MAFQSRISVDRAAHHRPHAVRVPSRLDPATRSMLDGLAQLHAIVMVTSADRRVLWLHESLQLLSDVGANEADLIGKPVTTLLRAIRFDDLEWSTPESRQFVEDLSIEGRAASGRFEITRGPRGNGAAGRCETMTLDVRIFPMVDAGGEKIFVSTADPCGSRQDLEQKNEELEACVRGVSHDLRSPLVSLLGFASLLRQDYHDALGHDGLHFVDRIDQAARNMEQLLQDMLELSRIGAKPELEIPIHPTPILEQIRSELKLKIDERRLELRLPTNPPTLICDRTRLYQLFSNLISNAVKHAGTGSIGGLIEVAIDEVSDGWQLSVRDDGPGIAVEDQTRIFGAFETAGGRSAHAVSSGLGLAIVKKIVDLHAGRVWVESQPGQGATFFVWLPTR